MKNPIKLIAAGLFFLGASVTSCDSTKENVEEAQENVDEAERELEIANNEYLEDMENYKKETSVKIEANNKSIIDFNKRIANEKTEAKEEYQKKIAELDQKNSDLKMRMENYQASGKENWEVFKSEFNRDMDALGTAFTNVFSKETPKK